MLNGAKQTPLSDDIRALLLQKLEETAAKCEKLSANVYEQERYFSCSIVPEVEANRAKAAGAYESVHTEIQSERTLGDMLGFFRADLANRNGLFYQIFRGKINKYVVPELPEDVQGRAKFDH